MKAKEWQLEKAGKHKGENVRQNLELLQGVTTRL